MSITCQTVNGSSYKQYREKARAIIIKHLYNVGLERINILASTFEGVRENPI